MGTRNLTAVKINGEYKIAQYGQWDGYPGGQGATALNFLRNERNRNKLKKALKHCVFVSQEEMDETVKRLGLDGKDFWTMEEGRKWDAEYPFFTRDHGAEILRLVANASKVWHPIKLKDSLDFAADSLFCEWAYVVDFDTNTFEVYKGFNTTLLKKTDRFASLPLKQQRRGENKYFPVRLVKSYKLGRLPNEDRFISQINELTGEAEE